eukprot:TRINITY_DN1529_c0_g2_i3.p2 TRINITY_DN1529_c0_g2~~TRINITY_DN1529_c0_g2_i3.p2  ORF type:complete len:109 (+),score=14.80 TRINITY_DN1529_c0_g2_i3:253-579(+)
MWNLANKQCLFTFRDHDSVINCIVALKGRGFLAKRFCMGVFIGHERKKINTLCALDNPCFLASGGIDDLKLIWIVIKKRGHCLRRLIVHIDFSGVDLLGEGRRNCELR